MKIPMPMKPKRKPDPQTDLTPVDARSPAMANMMGKLLGPERTFRSDMQELRTKWLKWCDRLLEDSNATLGELWACYKACPDKSLAKAIALHQRIKDAERAPKPPRP